MPKLRPYQKAGVERLRSLGRAILADEPGLGKSAQALAAAEPPVLVIAPGHTHGVWLDEVAKWMPNAEVTTYSGYGRKKRVPSFEGYDVVIANYASLDEVLRTRWQTVIFDEAHALKNRKAPTLFRMVRRYIARQASIFMLTGSPVFEHPGDFWPLLYIIDRKRWPGYWQFAEKYCFVSKDAYGWSVEGARNLPELRTELADVLIRRTYADVGRQLPPFTRRKYRVELAGKQLTAYNQLHKEMMAELDDGRMLLAPTKLAVTTRLRQLLVSPRIFGIEEDGAALTALRGELTDNPRPVVVFTPFTEAMPYIHDALAEADYEVIEHIRGGLKSEQVTRAWRSFERAPGPGKAIIAQVSMGTGWPATTAAEAFFVGMDWSAPIHDQAERRLLRDGQRRAVIAHYFVHTGTLEEDQLEILGGKKKISDVVLKGSKR